MQYHPLQNPIVRRITLATLIVLGGAGISACEEKKGPMERAGESIDEGARDAKRALEDAAD